MQTKDRSVISIPARRVICTVVTVALAIGFVCPVHADDSDVRLKSKIAGLPVGLVKEAFGNPDGATRAKLVGLLADRIVRNNGARTQFLSADVTSAAAFLASYSRSEELLSAAMSRTDDAALRDKLSQILAAITVARSGAPQ